VSPSSVPPSLCRPSGSLLSSPTRRPLSPSSRPLLHLRLQPAAVSLRLSTSISSSLNIFTQSLSHAPQSPPALWPQHDFCVPFLCLLCLSLSVLFRFPTVFGL
jgi:hypothetical protein